NFSLIDAVLAHLLADVNQFGALHCMSQQFSAHQSIVKNNLRLLQTVFALQGEQIGISRPCADQIDFTQSGRHRLAPSMISYWKVQDLSYPDRTGLQLRLVRYGIPCRGRKVIGSFTKAVLSAPV